MSSYSPGSFPRCQTLLLCQSSWRLSDMHSVPFGIGEGSKRARQVRYRVKREKRHIGRSRRVEGLRYKIHTEESAVRVSLSVCTSKGKSTSNILILPQTVTFFLNLKHKSIFLRRLLLRQNNGIGCPGKKTRWFYTETTE